MKTAPAFQELKQQLRASMRHVLQAGWSFTHTLSLLIGMVVLLTGLVITTHPEWQHDAKVRVMQWLQTSMYGELPAEAEPPVTVGRATATHPHTLSRQQAAVTYWLSRRYRVAPEPLSALIKEAYVVGRQYQLDPLLLVSVMAIESGFNPFAQSPVGAQGLMQVMTQLHSERYEPFGGQLAAFDPATNLQVGAKLLREYINRTGSVEGGLKRYVGAANLPHDGGYTRKVLDEYQRLLQISRRAAQAGRTSPSAAATITAPGTMQTVALANQPPKQH